MIETEPRVGQITPLTPGVMRLTAPNPSPMTGVGTNTYIVGRKPYAVVDPGVDDPAHLDRIWEATGGDIQAVWLTHRHPDHSNGAAGLAERAGVPVRAWPKHELAAYDIAIAIDSPLAAGERLDIGGERVIVHHTPGHAADHLCFELPDADLILAGDCVMADATVVILPPDGVMRDYFASLEYLKQRASRRLAPAHGRVLIDGDQAITAILAHRREREAQIAAALSIDEPATAETIAATLYPGLDGTLQRVAVEQVRAHLLYLAEQHRAVVHGIGWRAPGAC